MAGREDTLIPLVLLLLAIACSDLQGQQIVPDTGTAPGDSRVPPARALLSAPGADTVAMVTQGARIEFVAEQDDWVKVRLEGWATRTDLETLVAIPDQSLGLAEIRRDPEGYTGGLVRWTVQNLGLQRADSLRADMSTGEPYLLVRDPGGEAGLAYVTVPPNLLAAASSLGPLQRFEIVGRLRTGRSHLTGHPIVELLELRQLSHEHTDEGRR